MGKISLSKSWWWARAVRGGLGSLFASGLACTLDRRAASRLWDASQACAAVSAALNRALMMGQTDRSGFGAAWAEMEGLRARTVSPEERFIVDCVLHALGEASEPPKLPDEPLASHSWRWRQARRQLRRFGAALGGGASLGASAPDWLAEVGVLLDKMRQDGWPGVAWPGPGSLARDEATALK